MESKKRFNPLHGGDLVAASDFFGVALEEWIDLSTGMNPEPYPVEKLSESAFYQLPYLSSDFLAASNSYYQTESLLAVSGTQSAIQALPQVLPQKRILIPQVGYQEHFKHWHKSEAEITFYPSLNKQEACEFVDQALKDNAGQHVLVINPNNPSGLMFEKDTLLRWASSMEAGAYLIVDEAFIDLEPEASLTNLELPSNIIILRSFGKFFGLPGIRLGYVAAEEKVLSALEEVLGLWQVNGPAQDLAIKALNDTVWQLQAREGIAENRKLTTELFAPLMEQIQSQIQSEQGLFASYLMTKELALEVFEYFARAGVLLRVVDLGALPGVRQSGTLQGQGQAQGQSQGQVQGKALLRIGLVSQKQQSQIAYLKDLVSDYPGSAAADLLAS